MQLKHLSSKSEFDTYTKQHGVNLVHFMAKWASACGQLNEIFEVLVRELRTFNVAIVEAEDVPEASLQCGVTAAPTVVFFKDGKEVDKIHGFHPTDIKNLIVKHTFSQNHAKEAEPESKEDLTERIKRLINHNRVTLFMKGNPQTPKCGFSRTMIGLLDEHKIDYWTFDILEDPEVRQGLKEYSDWPTYPQLYLDGELLGGLDVIKEELSNPSFIEKLPKRQH